MDRNQRTAAALIDFVGTASLAATIFGAPQIAAVLALGHTFLQRGADGRAALESLTADIVAMTAAGRAPSMEEFSVLMARNQAAHDRIQSYGETQPLPEPPPPVSLPPADTPSETPIDGGTLDVDLTTSPATVTAEPGE